MKRREIFRLTAVLTALMLLFAACGDREETVSETGKSRSAIGTESRTETEEETETETKEPQTESVRTKLEATEIYKSIRESVVQLNIYDSEGTWTSLGSGFFVDDSGLILTNYHVISGAAEIYANDYNGNSCPVTEIEGFSEELDIAYVRIDAATKAVTLNREEPEVGETVYTLGSSEGLTGTFSDGIISTVSREIDGVDCIQITAPISHGNSGGPLINAYGEVIGINSMFYSEGQNLNFAININETDRVDLSSPISISQFAALDTASETTDYEQQYTIVYNEGDEGMEVYDICDFIELEDNGSAEGANRLTDSCFMAGYLDTEDFDMFSFTVSKEQEIYLAILPYWEEDNDQLVAALVDEDCYVYTDDSGEELYFTEYDEDKGWFYIDITLPAGTYYLAAMLAEDYPYENGCYYCVGAVFE